MYDFITLTSKACQEEIFIICTMMNMKRMNNIFPKCHYTDFFFFFFAPERLLLCLRRTCYTVVGGVGGNELIFMKCSPLMCSLSDALIILHHLSLGQVL